METFPRDVSEDDFPVVGADRGRGQRSRRVLREKGEGPASPLDRLDQGSGGLDEDRVENPGHRLGALGEQLRRK